MTLSNPSKFILQALISITLCVIFLILSSDPADAAIKTWNPTGCASASWNTAGNWTGGLPGTTDVATFKGTTSNCAATIDTNIDVGGINISSSYTGTITQSSTFTVTLEASGYTQNASGSTFTGGSGGITIANTAGVFTLTTGTFTSTSGTLSLINNFSNSGTFTANGGTVQFLSPNGSFTMTGSTTFYNLIFDDTACNGCGATYTLASGTTFTVNNTLTLQNLGSGQGGCDVNGPGGISAKGDITLAGTGSIPSINGCEGTAVITVNGSGTQTITGVADDTHFLPGLTINKSTGTLNFVNNIVVDRGNWTYSQGTLNMGTSNIIFKCDQSSCTDTITGSMTFYQLTFDTHSSNGFSSTYTIAAGTVLTVSDNLTLTNNGNTSAFCKINGPGVITAQGNILITGGGTTGYGCQGSAVITISGSGAQTITGGSNGYAYLPSININKTSGVLNLTNTIAIDQGWTYTNGDVNTGSSTVYFNTTQSSGTTITGSMTFNNITFDQTTCNTCNNAYLISSGTTITATGTATLTSATTPSAGSGPAINGPGILNLQGDMVTSDLGGGGTVAITMSGSDNQMATLNGTGFPSGTFTINKTAGTVTLATNVNLSGTGQDLVISSGVLNIGTYNLTVNDILTISGQLNQTTGTVTADSVSIGTKGIWENNSDGDFVLGVAGLSNAGYLHFDGSGPLCGGSDTIAITSSLGGTARTWSGAGTFLLNDVTVTDQNGSLTAYSSTVGSNSNWTFNPSCPAYSNRSAVKVTGGGKIIGGAKLQSN